MSPPNRKKKAATPAPKRKPRDLSRDKVIAAGLALVDKTGAHTITMRGLADAVGVTPMALYNHFSSKRDLLSAVAQQVIGAAQLDGHHASWRDQVHHCFEVLRGLCLRHPGLPKFSTFTQDSCSQKRRNTQMMTAEDDVRTGYST